MSWTVSRVEGKEYPLTITENLTCMNAVKEVIHRDARKNKERYVYYIVSDNKSDYVLPICYDNFKSTMAEGEWIK